jgi:asparagine N-glycosylation enzyme membrane subunit Stt3
MPEYGVMTWWDNGNYILYRAERPAVANNFQTGVGASAKFFVAKNETVADSIMESHQSRYVVVDQRMGSSSIGTPDGVFDNIPTMAGENATSYFYSYRMLDPIVGGTTIYVEGKSKYYDTMYARMFYDHGCGGRNPIGNISSGLQHYRMVYANSLSDPVIVFEKVKGANMTGTAKPGATVQLRLNLTAAGENLTYFSQTRADQSGSYQFTVPYSTGDTKFVITDPAYRITSGGAATEVRIPADAVANGATVTAGDLS